MSNIVNGLSGNISASFGLQIHPREWAMRVIADSGNNVGEPNLHNVATMLRNLGVIDAPLGKAVETELHKIFTPVQSGALAKERGAIASGRGVEESQHVAGYSRPMSEAEALQIVKLYNLKVDEPIYIGGGGDGYFTSIVESYAEQQGSNFFSHNRRGTVALAANALHTLGKPVIIIGHSWGGYSALKVAGQLESKGIGVDLLVTVDPVGNGLSTAALKKLSADLKGSWVNIRATRYETKHDGFNGDKWADLGGRLSIAKQQLADVSLELATGHADFFRIMEDAKIISMINSVQDQ